jgi:hypothetical protein
MSVTALALLLTCAPAVEWTVDLDAQLMGKQAIDAGRSETHMLVGLRGGLLTELGAGVVTGFDVGLHLEPLPRTRGTEDVSSLAIEGNLWPRGVLGWRAAWGPLAVFPYAYVGPFAGLRLALLAAYGETRNTSHPTLGLRGGGGVRFRIGHAHLSLELGGGVRENGPEVTGLLSSGFWL